MRLWEGEGGYSMVRRFWDSPGQSGRVQEGLGGSSRIWEGPGGSGRFRHGKEVLEESSIVRRI